MKHNEQANYLYTILVAIFAVLIVTGNLIYQKFIDLFGIFQLSVGAIMYPVTFIITDLIAELYGRHKALFCTRLALALNIMVAFMLYCFDKLPALSWSLVNDHMFHQVFGFYGIAFISSLIACFCSQQLDVWLYLKMKEHCRILVLRNYVSTGVSLLLDTMVVLSILVGFGILPVEAFWQLLWGSYSYKLSMTILSGPIFIFLVHHLSLHFVSDMQK